MTTHQRRTAPPGDTLPNGNALAEIARAISSARLPPVHRWNPDYCGEIDMRILRDGTWLYQGTPIGRKPLVKLFSTVLRREPDGQFVLVTPVEKLGITVDDSPFLAVELTSEGSGPDRRLAFRLNTDDHVIVDAEHALWVEIDPATEEPSPYVHVRAGLNALIGRAVFYELVALAMDEQAGNQSDRLGLWSNGHFYPIDGSHDQ